MHVQAFAYVTPGPNAARRICIIDGGGVKPGPPEGSGRSMLCCRYRRDFKRRLNAPGKPWNLLPSRRPARASQSSESEALGKR